MFYVTLLAYVLLLFSVAWIVHRRGAEDPSSYAMAKRQVGAGGVFASVFTLIGAGEFLTVAALAFVNDGAAVLLLTGYGLGMILLGTAATIAKRRSEEAYYISLPDWIYDEFGPAAGLVSQVLTILAFFALLTLQLFAGAIVLSVITPMSFPWGLMTCATIVVAYLWWAGFAGVIVTDMIQFVLMALGLPILAFLVLPAGVGVSSVRMLDFSWIASVSVLLTGVFVVLGSGDIWQRLYAARSPEAARTGLIGAGVAFASYSVVLALIGVAAREAGLTDNPAEAFLAVVLSGDHSLLPILVVAAVFSAILSTADTETYLLASLLANEKRRWTGESTHSEVPRRMIRVWLLPVTLAAIVAAYFAAGLVEIYEFLLMALLALAPVVVFAPFGRLSRSSAVALLFVGLVTFIGMRIFTRGLDFAVLTVVPGLLLGAYLSLRAVPTDRSAKQTDART